MAVGQRADQVARGGYSFKAELSHTWRTQAQVQVAARQFCKPDADSPPGLHHGDTTMFTRYRNLPRDPANRLLIEGQAIPTLGFLEDRGQIVVKEYGVGIDFTEKLALITESNITTMQVPLTLQNDMVPSLDAVAMAQFQATPLKYVPTGTSVNPTGTFSTNGIPGGAATRDLAAFDIDQIVLKMKKPYLIPPWPGTGGCYIALCSADAIYALKQTPEWRVEMEYAQPDIFFNYQLRKWRQLIIIEETSVLSSVLGTGTKRAEMLVFGADAVIEKIAVMEELRSDVPADFGRINKMAWYAFLGFQLAWDTANPGEVRVVHVTST